MASMRPCCRTAAGSSRAAPRASLPRWLVEQPQIRCRLVLARGHQQPVEADEIAFAPNGQVAVLLVADVLGPDRLFAAPVAPRNRPRPCERMIDDGDLVVEQIMIIPVEEDALLHDGLVVLV